MSSTQRRGFRLPWSADHGPDDRPPDGSSDAPAVDDGHGDPADAQVGSAESPMEEGSTGAVPAASDVTETTAEAEMSETQSPAAATLDPERPAEATREPSWPLADRSRSRDRDETTAAIRPGPTAADEGAGTSDNEGGTTTTPSRPEGEARSARKDNPLVAGLVKAMREAAIASRDESAARLQADATSRTEQIRAEATDEAAALRKQVDDDIAGIREWSKAEMARIRQETEQRIEARRAQAVAETERHLEEVERRVEAVRANVATFEAEMARFFEELLAESDPARLATLAERAPEPPDLSSAALASDGPEPAPAATAPLEPDAAAEAEAEATEGLDMTGPDAWPAAALAARMETVLGADQHPAERAAGGETQLHVSGLSSVAAISAFKGAVGQLPGVSSVSVTTGEEGVVIFNVNHEPETDLEAALAGLGGFAVALTDTSDGTFTVTANEAGA